MFQGEGAAIRDVAEAGILDLYLTKFWGLKYATNAVSTILKVDQIIMAKRAGGPKAPTGDGNAADDD
jgi:T-complex protein 1 subunit theta